MSEQKRTELREKVKQLRTLVTDLKAQQICTDVEQLIEELSISAVVVGPAPPKVWITYAINSAKERAAFIFLAANHVIAERTANEFRKSKNYVRDGQIEQVRDPRLVSCPECLHEKRGEQ